MSMTLIITAHSITYANNVLTFTGKGTNIVVIPKIHVIACQMYEHPSYSQTRKIDIYTIGGIKMQIDLSEQIPEKQLSNFSEFIKGWVSQFQEKESSKVFVSDVDLLGL
jgi:hypothetical protein